MADQFTQLIVQGSAKALNMAKSLLTSPILMNTDTTQGFPFAVPLEVEDHQQSIQAEVSESLVIAQSRKVNVADNIAPGSYTWQLSGYIPGMAALEISNYYTPFVQLFKDFIRNAASKGFVLKFKDIDCKIYQRVVIKNLNIKTQANCRNKTPFTMTLKEINVMSTDIVEETLAKSQAMIQTGLAIGAALSAGTILARIAESAVV